MTVIEGIELMPCKELHGKIGTDGYINLMTHCNHPRFQLGCLDGRGDCPDYEIAQEITDEIREVASQIARRE